MPEKELRHEISKWREFGYLLTESYDQLKRKYNTDIVDAGKNKQITAALKEQINKLKALLKHSSNENRVLREQIESNETSGNFISELKNKYEEMVEEVRQMRKENGMLARNLANRSQEKEILENEKVLNNKLVQQLNEKIKVRIWLKTK